MGALPWLRKMYKILSVPKTKKPYKKKPAKHLISLTKSPIKTKLEEETERSSIPSSLLKISRNNMVNKSRTCLINKSMNFKNSKKEKENTEKMAKNINLNTVNKNLGKGRANIAKNIKNAELKNAFNKLFAEGVKQMNDAAKKNNIKAGKSLFGQGKRKLNQNKGTIAKYQNQLNNQLRNNINKVKI